METVEPIRSKKKIEAMKIMLAAGREGDRNLLLFTLGINTAYRISDLGKLKLENVLEISANGHVVVKERLALREQKTGKHNSVILGDKLRKMIIDYCRNHFPDAIDQRDFDGYLFPSARNRTNPLSRQSIWRIISTAGHQVGLEHIGTHTMRKTFGYWLYKSNVSVEIIQQLLNHSNAQTTLRYIGITQDDKDNAVQSLNL
ncbi:tyrosine-type recombinase/integrase [Lapidilactobacillus dextrinicus]|jgi:integrase|uniref:tyrosine-type recombinase/integrase n=1 Tax=Lapidilactobacillus dextrinicus TaxID=51664 RepID=UPI003F26D868